MIARGCCLPLALLAACGGDGPDQAERQQALRAARAGMNAVRAIPGGKQASFTQVRLIGDDTVCGMLDGNDGFGARAFAVKSGMVTISDPHQPHNATAIKAACAGQPVRAITSRNAQFSDLDLAN